MSRARIASYVLGFACGLALLGCALALALRADADKPFPDTVQAWCAHDWQDLAKEHCL